MRRPRPGSRRRTPRGRPALLLGGVALFVAAAGFPTHAEAGAGGGSDGSAPAVGSPTVRTGAGRRQGGVRHDPGLEPVRLFVSAGGGQAGAPASGSGAFDAGRAPFSLRVGDRRIDYRIAALSVLPGETVPLALTGTDAGEAGALRYRGGRAREERPGRWTWIAPDRPGVEVLRVDVPATDDSVTLNVFVLHPLERVRDGVLNGYRIGSYPERPLREDPAYEPPRGFIELPEENENLAVSPHFTLGQFACKQPGDPRFLVVSAPLVVKLERILEEVNQSGRAARTLYVMSGYRTPFYNRAIGNRTSYSRHLWGDAADIWVDTDGDGLMDDWNGDGRSTVADARLLVELVRRVVARSGGSVRLGGLAAYRRNPVHGPFVHVDARGVRARW